MKEEKVLLNATVVFLVKKNKVLLGKKTRGIGRGRLNGPGGGIEEGEDIRKSATREVFEETGVKVLPDALEKVAIVHFHNIRDGLEKFICRCHIFITKEWEGEPQNTNELTGQEWFDINDLPLDRMMASDKEWLSVALKKKIIAHSYIGEEQAILVKPTEIIEMDFFPKD